MDKNKNRNIKIENKGFSNEILVFGGGFRIIRNTIGMQKDGKVVGGLLVLLVF